MSLLLLFRPSEGEAPPAPTQQYRMLMGVGLTFAVMLVPFGVLL